MKSSNNRSTESISIDTSEFDEHSRSRSRSPAHSYVYSSKSKDHDAMSIYIGNLDYSATENDLKSVFICCGDILRVTIIKNMKTGHPKGAAFIEFMHREAVKAAMKMSGTQVNGRPLTVTNKKPRPEKRPNRERYHSANYERPGARAPYFHFDRSPHRQSSRNYFKTLSAHRESRRSYHSNHQMPYESQRMPRIDYYRRKHMYDSYMVTRGNPNSISSRAYGHYQKYEHGPHTCSYYDPRYSNSLSRR